MPIFIALGTVTGSGMQALDHLTARHEEAVKRARRMGGRVISSYATMGRFDFVVTLDCPDMETAMTILNREAAGGNIKYETMVAMPTRDFATLFLDEASREDERRVLRVERRASKSRSASKTRKRSSKRPSKRGGAR
jgi:uncharacterized protein with GYD domain